MRIYFSTAIKHADPTLAVINEHIIKYLEDRNQDVIAPSELGRDGLSDQQVYDRDFTMILTCEAMVAECSTPSHGVGYEICLAQLVMPLPLLVVHRNSFPLSAMIRPCAGTAVTPYDSLIDLDIKLTRWLADIPRHLRDIHRAKVR